jgi:hypothetical protein
MPERRAQRRFLENHEKTTGRDGALVLGSFFFPSVFSDVFTHTMRRRLALGPRPIRDTRHHKYDKERGGRLAEGGEVGHDAPFSPTKGTNAFFLLHALRMNCPTSSVNEPHVYLPPAPFFFGAPGMPVPATGRGESGCWRVVSVFFFSGKEARARWPRRSRMRRRSRARDDALTPRHEHAPLLRSRRLSLALRSMSRGWVGRWWDGIVGEEGEVAAVFPSFFFFFFFCTLSAARCEFLLQQTLMRPPPRHRRHSRPAPPPPARTPGEACAAAAR